MANVVVELASGGTGSRVLGEGTHRLGVLWIGHTTPGCNEHAGGSLLIVLLLLLSLLRDEASAVIHWVGIGTLVVIVHIIAVQIILLVVVIVPCTASDIRHRHQARDSRRGTFGSKARQRGQHTFAGLELCMLTVLMHIGAHHVAHETVIHSVWRTGPSARFLHLVIGSMHPVVQIVSTSLRGRGTALGLVVGAERVHQMGWHLGEHHGLLHHFAIPVVLLLLLLGLMMGWVRFLHRVDLMGGDSTHHCGRRQQRQSNRRSIVGGQSLPRHIGCLECCCWLKGCSPCLTFARSRCCPSSSSSVVAVGTWKTRQQRIHGCRRGSLIERPQRQ
jgi:hypothetical protein